MAKRNNKTKQEENSMATNDQFTYEGNIVQCVGHELPNGFATWQELLERSDEYAKENQAYRLPYVKTHGVARDVIEAAAKFEANNK